MEASGGPAAGASEQARWSRCPCRRDRFDTLRSCAHAPSPSFLRPPPSFLHLPPSFLRPLRHSCAPLRHSCAPLRHSCAPLRHSCASFLRPLRHSCAGRNPGDLRGFENGADAGRPPVGPSAPSGGLVARRRDGGVGRPAAGASEQARCSPCPSRRDRFDTLRGCAHAPSPSFPRPAPSFLRPLRHSRAPLRHSCAGRNPGELRGFENGADAGRPPAGPCAPSGGLVARRRDGGVGRPAVGASEQARCSPCPSRRDRFDTLRSRAHAPPPSFLRPLRHSRAPLRHSAPAPSFLRPLRHSCAPLRHSCALSVIPAQAGIQASCVGSKTAPMLDGLPQVRAPPPAAWWPVGGMEASGGPGWSLRFLPAQE